MTTEQGMIARLARIMGDVGRVEKKGKISSTGSGPTYKFARDADVLEKVNPMMADAGCVMVPEHTELLSMEPTPSGRQILANIKTSWHVTDGKESLRFETLGQGADSGDKALPKAQSNARKYAYFMLFHIVTGDDPDQFGSHEQPERSERAPAARRAGSQPATTSAPVPSRYRRDELAALMAENGLTTDTIEVYAATAGIPRDERPMSNESMDTLIDTILESVRIEPAVPPAAVEAGSEEGVPTPSGPAPSGKVKVPA